MKRTKKVNLRVYTAALCDLVLSKKELGFIRKEALSYLFKFAKAEKSIVPYQDHRPAENAKNLPLAEKKTMLGLVYHAILKKLGRDDQRTMSIFKAAINHLSKDELDMEWEALEDGTVSNIINTMIHFDSQTDEVKQEITNIFEGLAKPYFLQYKGKVPKEDLQWAHNMLKDYFANLVKKEPLLKGQGGGKESPALPSSKKLLKAEKEESTFQIYDYTQPDTMKAKNVKCNEAGLEDCLRKQFKLRDNEESKLVQPKKGSWVFKAKGKEYTVSKVD